MAERMSEQRLVFASRDYDAGGRLLIANIYRPVPRGQNWVAECEIIGLSGPLQGRASGVDSMQAMLLAAQWIKIRMHALQIEFEYLDELRVTGIADQTQLSDDAKFAAQVADLLHPDDLFAIRALV